MSDWEYACRVDADGNEVTMCIPEERPRRVADVPRSITGSSTPPQILDLRGDGSGAAMFIFTGNHFPNADILSRQMSGFDRWSIFTSQQPFQEMIANGAPVPMTYRAEYPGWEPDGPLLPNGSIGVSGRELVRRAVWPYFYRALSQGALVEYGAQRVVISPDPSIARILAGESLRAHVPPDGLVPASSRAEMTYRHVRPGGAGALHGTDRVSIGRNMSAIYDVAGGTRSVVRIDPNLIGQSEFLSTNMLLDDLDRMARQAEASLLDATQRGLSDRRLARMRSTIEAISQARAYVLHYGEAHIVDEVPSSAMSPAAGRTAETSMRWGARGLRVAGGVMIVYGAYSSVQRVREAPQRQRPRVASQEVGGWAGGFAGAWLVGKAFAVGGAALGIETGPGAILTAAGGAIIGGVLGGIGGALGADWVYGLLDEETEAETCELACGTPASEIPWCVAPGGG